MPVPAGQGKKIDIPLHTPWGRSNRTFFHINKGARHGEVAISKVWFIKQVLFGHGADQVFLTNRIRFISPQDGGIPAEAGAAYAAAGGPASQVADREQIECQLVAKIVGDDSDLRFIIECVRKAHPIRLHILPINHDMFDIRDIFAYELMAYDTSHGSVQRHRVALEGGDGWNEIFTERANDIVKHVVVQTILRYLPQAEAAHLCTIDYFTRGLEVWHSCFIVALSESALAKLDGRMRAEVLKAAGLVHAMATEIQDEVNRQLRSRTDLPADLRVQAYTDPRAKPVPRRFATFGEAYAEAFRLQCINDELEAILKKVRRRNGVGKGASLESLRP